MYQPPQFITDQTGRHKLEASLPGGRYQLTLEDRAVNVLKNDLGLNIRDYVPKAFIPVFVAMGDAWLPRKNNPDEIIDGLKSNNSLTHEEKQVLVSYIEESRIPKRNEKRVKSVIKDSPVVDLISEESLQIQELPSIPESVDLSGEITQSDENRKGAERVTKTQNKKLEYETISAKIAELSQISGIGPHRARKLAEGGVESLNQLAEARPVELATINGITEGMASVAVEGAREFLGERPPVAKQLAEETGESKETFDSTLSALAAAGIPGTEAAPTLRILYGQTVADIDGISGHRAYFLWEAGYRTPADIAQATAEELTEVYQIGETTAQEIQSAAKELLSGN